MEKSKISFIDITPTPQAGIPPGRSSFGNYPCIPKSFAYPVDSEGHYMFPLAQINFAEMPSLPGYPTNGYLQFYIAASDGLYGLDFDHPQEQKNFRVLYFPPNEVTDPVTDFSFLKDVITSDIVPVTEPYILNFTLREEYIGLGDQQYKQKQELDLYQLIGQYPEHENRLETLLYEHFSNNGHKIGGYAFFTQEDPRFYDSTLEDYILLFQMDSEDGIMWGDSGVANFFIHPDDLKKKDFSKVVYNWDCC
ncbi:MAG: DUF1963 domain-containing protein [Chitinophagaceae bacterium]|nr:DUF1963 domain-containing protein [Chitinophagaceae bacterium]